MQPSTQRPPVLWDHFLVAKGVVPDDRFYCILLFDI